MTKQRDSNLKRPTVLVAFTLAQIRLLQKIVDLELAEVENFGELENGFKEIELQALVDVLEEYAPTYQKTDEQRKQWQESWQPQEAEIAQRNAQGAL